MSIQEKSVAAQNAAAIFGSKGAKLQDIITTFKAISKDLQQKLSQSTDVQVSAVELFNIINKIDGFGDSNIADQALMDNNSLVEAKNILQSAALLINDSFINYMSYDNKEALVALLESLDLENEAQGLSQNLSDELYNQIAAAAKPGLFVPNDALTEAIVETGDPEDEKIIINVIKRLQEINKQIVNRLEVNAYQASQDAYKQATDKIVLNQILYHVFDKVDPKYVAQSGYDVDIFEHFEKADQDVKEVAKFLRNNIDTYNAEKTQEAIINPEDFPADTDDIQSNFENDDYLDQDIPPEEFVTQETPQDITRAPDIIENRIEDKDQDQDQEAPMDEIQDQITGFVAQDQSQNDQQEATQEEYLPENRLEIVEPISSNYQIPENRIEDKDQDQEAPMDQIQNQITGFVAQDQSQNDQQEATQEEYLPENRLEIIEQILSNYQIPEDSLNASSQNSALPSKAKYAQAELDDLYNKIEAKVEFSFSGKVVDVNHALTDGVKAIWASYPADEQKLVERIKEMNEQIVNRIDKVDPKQQEKDMKVLSSSLAHLCDCVGVGLLPSFGYDAATFSRHIQLADKIDETMKKMALANIQAKPAAELEVFAESQVASQATEVNELFKNLVAARDLDLRENILKQANSSAPKEEFVKVWRNLSQKAQDYLAKAPDDDFHALKAMHSILDFGSKNLVESLSEHERKELLSESKKYQLVTTFVRANELFKNLVEVRSSDLRENILKQAQGQQDSPESKHELIKLWKNLWQIAQDYLAKAPDDDFAIKAMHSTLNFGSQYIADNLADSLNAREREKLLSDLQKYELESFCGNLNAKLLQKGLSQEQGELSCVVPHQSEFQQGNGDDSDYEPIKNIGVVYKL